MIGASFKFSIDGKKLDKAVEKAAFKNFAHAAASIRKDAIESIEEHTEPIGWMTLTLGGETKKVKVYQPSPTGTPPYSHRRGKMFFRRAIRFDATKEDVIVGPTHSESDTIMEKHEHGERPFMGPAMEANLQRFASSWAGAVTGD